MVPGPSCATILNTIGTCSTPPPWGGGGVKLALLRFWLIHPPTLRPTHPPARYAEGSQSNFG